MRIKQIGQTRFWNSKNFQWITKGWLWTIVPWQAEVTWPHLPDLAQRALNASNNVASLMSELEVCVSISEFAELMPAGSSFSSCVEAVKMNQPPCQAGSSQHASSDIPANAPASPWCGRIARGAGARARSMKTTFCLYSCTCTCTDTRIYIYWWLFTYITMCLYTCTRGGWLSGR